MMTIGPEFSHHRELLAICDRIRAHMEAQRDTPSGRIWFAEIERCKERHEREAARKEGA